MQRHAKLFLKVLAESQASTVASTSLESLLNLNYKQVAKTGSYLSEIGAVQQFNNRGGTSDYSITPLGIKLYFDEKKQQKRNIIIGITLVIFVLGFMIFGQN